MTWYEIGLLDEKGKPRYAYHKDESACLREYSSLLEARKVAIKVFGKNKIAVIYARIEYNGLLLDRDMIEKIYYDDLLKCYVVEGNNNTGGMGILSPFRRKVSPKTGRLL